MSQNKKIVKNSLILYFKLIITSIIGLYASRVVLQNLGVSDFGLYSVVGSVVVMMAFLNTVMVSTTYRYIAFELGLKKKGNINKIFNISLTIHLFMIILVIVLAETVGIWYIHNKLNVESSKINDAIFVFRMSTLATLFSIISIPYQGLITALEKFKVRAFVEIFNSILKLLFVISLAYFKEDKLRIYAIMMMILSIVSSTSFIYYCKQKHADFVSWKIQRDREKYKEMIAYSSWIMIGAAASVGKSTGSQLIINAFFGTILNAAFGIANRLNTFVLMFSRNLGQAAIPQIIKSFSGGDKDRTFKLVAYVSKYSFLLILIPSLPILLETKYLLVLWLGEIPEYTVAFSRLMIINGLIDSLSSGVSSAVQATGKIKWYQIIMSGINLLSLPLAYFLFKLGYPPFYIQVVYISIAIFSIVIRLIVLKKIINFDIAYLVKTSYMHISFVFISILPFFWIVNLFEPSFYRFFSISFVSLLWLFLMIYLVGMESKEKIMIKKQFYKILNKIKKWIKGIS